MELRLDDRISTSLKRRFQRLAAKLRKAFTFGRARLKSFRFSGGGGGTASSIAEFFGFGRQLPGSEFDYRTEAGNLWENGVVLAIIKWVCRNYHEARLVVERPDADGKAVIAYFHPIIDLLENPSEDFDQTALEAGYVLSYACDGNAYLVKVRGEFGNVVGMHYVPHFMMTPYWPKDGSEFITGYIYRVNGQTYLIPKSEVVHLRDGLDPLNTRKGLAAFSAVLREICTDNEAATFSAALLRNSGVPTVVFSPKDINIEPLSPQQIEQYKRDYVETLRGENVGEPWVNGIPIDMHVPGFSPEQLVLDKVRSIPVERICAAFGLDPMVLSLPSTNKTYSNYQAAKVAAYDACVKPLHRVIDSQMTRQLMPDMIGTSQTPVTPKDRLARDYTCVAALAEDVDQLHKRWRENYSMGVVTRKTALERIGEPADDARDDVYFTDIKTQQIQIMADAKIDPDSSAT